MGDERRGTGHVGSAGEGRKGFSRRDFLETATRLGGGSALVGALTSLGLARIATAEAPEPPAADAGGPRLRIAVLGAGIGGLVAAYELCRKHDVTVFEANGKVGGRSLTLRPGDPLQEAGGPIQTCTFKTRGRSPYPPYLNAGPGRLPSAHTLILDYCRKLNVDLEVYVMESRSNYVQTGDRQSLVNRHAVNDARGHIAHLLYQRVDSITDLDSTQRQQLKELLRTFGALGKDGEFIVDGANPPGRRYATSTRSGYRVPPGVHDGVSVVPFELDGLLATEFWKTQVYQPEDFLWQPTLFQPVGGMDKIGDKLKDGIPEKSFELSKVVRRIFRSRGKWAIDVGESQPTYYDVVISNIPMPLLENRLNRSDLSEKFSDALGAIYEAQKRPSWVNKFLAPTCKVGWQAPRNLWQSAEPPHRVVAIYGGISWTDPPVTQIWYPSDRIHDELGVLTGTYNYGTHAESFGKLSPAQRLDVAKKGATKVGGQKFSDGLAEGITIAWQNMPFQQGGWAQWQNVPGDSRAVYNTLLEGSNGFYVCGDQLSKLPGWKEGAVASALHVVRQITDSTYVVPKIEAVPDSRLLVEGIVPVEA